MRIVIGGASGLIGTELSRQLVERGDEVIRLVRRPATGRGEVSWDPAARQLDPEALAGADAVVDLSGATIGRMPWTREYKAQILDSRLAATRAIVGALHALAATGQRVPVLVNASALSGSGAGVEFTESSPPGAGFLGDVVRQWEAAALEASDVTRVVLARTGIVIGLGGAAGVLARIARLGVAGPIAGGHRYWPWIGLHDEAAAFVHLIDSDLSGPVNLVGPTPATSGEVVRAIASAVGRPAFVPLPGWGVSTVLGEAGRELLLADQRVRPEALLASGFTFRDTTVEAAVEAMFA